MFRAAIAAEILFAARVTQTRFLKRLSGKTPLEQNSSGKKIEAESAVPILVYLCIVIMVHKYRQSTKESCLLKRNTVPEVFPHIQYFYDKYNKNKKLSVPEYAEKLLENFKKTDALDYDGGELK